MSNYETVAALCIRANAIIIDAAAKPRTTQVLIDCASHLRVLSTLLNIVDDARGRPWSTSQRDLALRRAREIFDNYAICESAIVLAHGARAEPGSTEDWLDRIHRRA